MFNNNYHVLSSNYLLHTWHSLVESLPRSCKVVSFVVSFRGWENQSTERLNDLSKVTTLGSCGARIDFSPELLVTCMVSPFFARRGLVDQLVEVPHFKDEKAKAMTSWVTWPRSHRRQWMGRGAGTGLCSLSFPGGLQDLSEIFLPLWVGSKEVLWWNQSWLLTAKRKTNGGNYLEHPLKRRIN